MIERYRPRATRQGDHEVGYGRPPLHTRFKSGQSGNPRGRPKGRRNLATDLAAELAERVVITEGGQKRKISKQQAVVKTLAMRALRGDVRASDTLLKLVERHLMTGEEAGAAQPLPSEDRAIIERFMARYANGPGDFAGHNPGEDSEDA